ncbi:MAG TPA: radical SAM protein [Geobacteraceae bacterium]|nr:radical SAM protein [Geobacteraceae bacterium]
MGKPAGEILREMRREELFLPKTLTIAITGRCNLACRHCWVGAGEGGSGDVPERTLRRMLVEFRELEGEGVCLTGGEPLCHPAWLRILQFARALGFEKASLQTNAMLIGDRDAELLRDLGFTGSSIRVSLDGASPASHDLVRGDGAFRGALLGIEALVRHGLGSSITLCFTEMRHNLGEFPDLLRLADSLGLGGVSCGTLVRFGRGATSNLIAPPELTQYGKLLRRYDSDPVFRELYGRLGSMAFLSWQQGEPPAAGCTFVENPYLAADGRLYPCVMCHADSHAVFGAPGKGLVASFAEGYRLWSSLMNFSRSRSEEMDPCASCSGRTLCGGGCLGRSWAAHGDFLAPDDRCSCRRSVYIP